MRSVEKPEKAAYRSTKIGSSSRAKSRVRNREKRRNTDGIKSIDYLSSN